MQQTATAAYKGGIIDRRTNLQLNKGFSGDDVEGDDETEHLDET
jgi:hypothetical protein